MNILTVTYDAFNGDSVPDALAENYVNSIIDRLKYEDVNVTVGSDMIVSHIRLAIGLGKLHHEDVTFLFKDEVIKFGRYGSMVQPSRWPDGFCDHVIIVTAAISKIRRVNT